MPTTKFSVIVPVYNTAKYLPNCIDSIINQGYENLELILIDDGSTDSSPNICDDYANKDKRIKVIHKQNEGQAIARNEAILITTGDFLVFIDSDDYIEPATFTTFDKAIQAHPDIDVLTSNLIRYVNDKVKKQCFITIQSPISGHDFLKIQAQKNRYAVGPVRFIVNRQFLINHNIMFPKYKIHEDELWAPRLLLSAEKVFTLDFVYYHHIIRHSSSTHPDNEIINRVKWCLEITRILENVYEKLEDSELKAAMMNHLVTLFMQSFIILCRTHSWKDYKLLFDKKFLKNKATSPINKVLVLMFYINPNLICLFKKTQFIVSKILKYITNGNS